VCFVDPHGDSVEKVLNYVPSNRVNDVIYLNPADVDFPIAFNPLEAVDPKHKHLVASGLMGVFTKIWAGVWSPRMEYILQNTILALLDSPGNTMLGVARMYVDKAYRKKIVDNIKDPVVKSFWVDEFANYQDKFRTEAVAPIQNKVGQFLSNAIIRNIVGQTKSTIDLREVMDGKKILLLNLSKGRIGEDSSALLGAMIITKLQLAAMSRVDVPEEDRQDFYLYVDEFQNFATESFANILSEARKYRLNLIVAHQYIGQLVQDRNTIVRDAIFGNVGTMIAFRVGADDAEFLEKEFEPVYTMNDLVNLSKFNIYLKLMINGVASSPFSATTLPPISEPTGNTDKVIKVSRERYAVPRLTVEQKISKWLGAEFHAEAARVESDSLNEEGVEENFRFKSAPRTAAPASRSAQAAPSRPSPIQAPEPKPAAAPAEIPVPEAVKPPKPEAAHERRHSQPRAEARHDDERRHKERRTRQEERHPGRRSTDRRKPKHENPIWDTVNKLTSQKLADQANLAQDAIDAMRTPPKPAPKINPPEPVRKSVPQPPQPKSVQQKPPAVEPTPDAPAPVPSTPDRHTPNPQITPEKKPQDHTSPHINVQDTISRHVSVQPGETVKFD
jgi:hypothetical protein